MIKKKLTNNSRGLISTKRKTHFLNQYELNETKKMKITHERGDSPSLPVQHLKMIKNKKKKQKRQAKNRVDFFVVVLVS